MDQGTGINLYMYKLLTVCLAFVSAFLLLALRSGRMRADDKTGTYRTARTGVTAGRNVADADLFACAPSAAEMADNPEIAVAFVYEHEEMILQRMFEKQPEQCAGIINLMGRYAGEAWLLAIAANKVRENVDMCAPDPSQTHHVFLKNASIEQGGADARVSAPFGKLYRRSRRELITQAVRTAATTRTFIPGIGFWRIRGSTPRCSTLATRASS